MAWLAVDKDRSEHIFQNRPIRDFEYDAFEDPVYQSFDRQGGALEFHHYSDIGLPKGSIKKLIGRDLTWEDNPVELKEE